ncbi:apolipoprotein N-acyltransferase [Salipiger bermudensis]|nr:apolipoprotein N-acyltransferase [Salipiger bermudensis]
MARLALAILAGAALGLGQAPWAMTWAGFAGLVAIVALFSLARAPRAALATGWGAGLGYFALVLNWVTEPFQVDAATTGWMAPFALVLLAAGLALFWALAFWCAARAAPGRRLLALVVAWSAVELARAYVLTGFAWATLGSLWAPTDALQWAAWIGTHGLTVVTLGIAVLVVGGARDGRAGLPRLALGLAGLAALVVGGAAITPPLQDLAGRPVVRLVQPNAPQHQKWDRSFVPIFFERQVEYTAAPASEGLDRPSLTVWPETALPMLLQNADDALARISDAAGPAKVALGIQRVEDGTWFNSLALAGPGGAVEATYDKHHLVPFGEYMPFASLFARIEVGGLAQRAAGGYGAGPGPRTIDLGPELGRALPLICYEAVFPQDLRSPQRPDLLLQITNDAWFGTVSGPYQHLSQARMRAVEQGLPLLRAANTGISAVIDGAGRVLDSLPLGEAGYLDTALPPPLRVTLYSRTGDLPLALLLGLLAFTLCLPRRRVSVDGDSATT